jgi:hypothetical protein
MKQLFRIVACAVALSTSVQAQSDFRAAIDVPALLRQLESPVDTSRANAFYSLLWEPPRGPYNPGDRVAHLLAAKPAFAQRIKAALIRTLEHENGRPLARKPALMPPPYQEYYGHLVWSVGALKDTSAVRALVGAIHSGVADAGLVMLGSAAEPALRVASASTDPIVKAAAIRVLGRIATESGRKK